MSLQQSHNSHFNQAGLYITPALNDQQPSRMKDLTATPLGNVPQTCVCPNCRQSIQTSVEKTNGLLVWIVAGGIFLAGGIFGCCLIPFCIDGLKDTTHHCPSCNCVVGQQKVL